MNVKVNRNRELLYENNKKNDFVDFGLPSGTKWAKCNIGAESEEEIGLYFAWGDPNGYPAESGHYFNSTNYSSVPAKQLPSSENIGKYPTRRNDFDSAYINSNGKQRMPTYAEFQELIANTSAEMTSINGVGGLKLYKPESPSIYIFFPWGGYYSNTTLNNITSGGIGYYWTDSPRTNSTSYAFMTYGNYRNLGYDYSYLRYRGLCLRGVKV